MPAAELPHALRDRERFLAALGVRRPAVFLDYDGVLTPIVERPEDARMSEPMRQTVRELAERCPVCVVSGRDRAVVQELMGLDDLVVAGSHGFDIWHPERGTLAHDAASGYEDLITGVTERLCVGVGQLEGVQVEPKRASVAVHYRRAAAVARERVGKLVERLLAERPDELKLTPGKMVYELQPKLDWHKGAAVRYLLDVLELTGEDVVPLYLGDDVTDEDAFRALRGVVIGVYVGRAEELDRETAADFAVDDVDQVRQLLDTLGR
ncbi:MAG: trehalose-phosphatase [Pseudonocardiales bacterium]|nr:trehalose-phosphatase [Pseudonocardiales bacterium]